jgi:hypothetical protein
MKYVYSLEIKYVYSLEIKYVHSLEIKYVYSLEIKYVCTYKCVGCVYTRDDSLGYIHVDQRHCTIGRYVCLFNGINISNRLCTKHPKYTEHGSTGNCFLTVTMSQHVLILHLLLLCLLFYCIRGMRPERSL